MGCHNHCSRKWKLAICGHVSTARRNENRCYRLCGELGRAVHTLHLPDVALPHTPMIAAALRRRLRGLAAIIFRAEARAD